MNMNSNPTLGLNPIALRTAECNRVNAASTFNERNVMKDVIIQLIDKMF